MVNQRVAVLSLEGNAIAVLPGGHDGRDDELTIWVSTQMPHGFRGQAAQILGLDAERVRVITPHVGGGFGGKAGVLAEHTVAIGVARALGRPVSWVETRSENLVSMPHGRGQIAYYELGLTREGRITGLRARVVGDAGAYAGFGGALTLGPTYVMSQGVYDIPKIAFDGAVALTNTTPMGAFRGAGRPEATAYLERMLDLAAVELAIDPAELRRRNFLDPASFPVTTLPGARYDVGDYDLPLREALRLADYDKLREEQRTRREAGDPVQLGIGISVYVEITAGGGGSEYGAVTVHADGSATIAAGTSAHGQGHATAFAMLASDRLGIPFEKIRFVQSDTAIVPRGSGTGGSRSLQMGGNAVLVAADDVLEQARHRAAELLEAAVDDVALTDDGEFGVSGVPSATVTWAQVASHGEELHRGPGLPPGRGHLPVRRARVRGGGRHRDGPRHAAPAHRRRRLRPHPQPAARRRPAARRPRAGRRAGAVRGGPLRRRRPAAHGLARRLPDAQRGRPLLVRAAQHRDPHADEPVGRQGDRRVGHGRLHARGAERGGRRAPAVRGAARRHAVHAGAGVAGHPGGGGRTRGASPRRCSPRSRCASGSAAAEGGEI